MSCLLDLLVGCITNLKILHLVDRFDVFEDSVGISDTLKLCLLWSSSGMLG